MKLIIASTNDAKIKEIEKILDTGIQFITYHNLSNWPQVEESGKTFYENALIKASRLTDKYKLPALADDSGLIVEALGQEPGVRSSRYAGDKATDAQNMTKLLHNLKKATDRKAYFTTSVVLYGVSKEIIATEGKVYGRIINQPKGTNGFGYDPVFIPDGRNKTFAEMTSEEKNKLSHRSQAIHALKALLTKKGLL